MIPYIHVEAIMINKYKAVKLQMFKQYYFKKSNFRQMGPDLFTTDDFKSQKLIFFVCIVNCKMLTICTTRLDTDHYCSLDETH